MMQRKISDASQQIDALDGLRGFAALIVVFSHTSNAKMYFLPGLDLRGTGKTGVLLFFVLSAFLLARPLLQKGSAMISKSEMAHYWQRRFFRIYPLYTLYLLAGLISTYLIAHYMGKSDVGIPFSLSPGEFFRHMTLQEGKMVTWSIAVEFKFYFVLPVIAYGVFLLRDRLGFAAAIVGMFLLIAAVAIYSPQAASLPDDPRLTPYLPVFFGGILLAVLQAKIDQLGTPEQIVRVLRVLGYVGLAGVAFMTPLVFSIYKSYTGGGWVPSNYFTRYFLELSLCWSLVLLSCVNVPGYLQRVFMWQPLRYFGALSFSLYLFHIVFVEIAEKLSLSGYAGAYFVLATSTLASFLSFKIIEEPVSKFKLEKFFGRKAAKTSAGR